MECKIDYKNCFIKSADCGPCTFRNISGVFRLNELNDNIQCGKSSVKENLLIESRTTEKPLCDSQICAHHRITLGGLWKTPKCCMHPLHQKTTGDWRKAKKKSSLRTASLDTYYLIKEKFPGCSFPMFGNLCSKHRSTDIEGTPQLVEFEDNNDLDFVTVRNSSFDDSSMNSLHSLINNTTGGAMSPVKYRIAKPVDEMADSSMRYHKRKFKEYMESSKQTYLSHIAPGQEEQASMVFCDSDEEIANIPDNLKLLYDAYVSTDNEKQRTLILSAIPVKSYTMAQITNFFGCTKHRVQAARKWRNNFGALNVGQQQQFTRQKLDMNAAQDFLEFLFSSNLLQDVAYGTSSLKFDDGSTQTVSKAILTLSKTHVIIEYKKYCDKFGLKKLSDSTLWQILKAIKPGQQRAMAGLDNVTADGILGFKLLSNHLDELAIDSKMKIILRKDLDAGKRYLKIGYAQHCSFNTSVNTHCISHALSSKDDNDFKLKSDHSHDERCTSCTKLLATLEKVSYWTEQLPKSEEKDDMQYDIGQAIHYILTWMKHIIRGVQQEKAKTFAMENIDMNKALWISDWAQKILPLRYREGQKEYFGKKGMSLHVDVLLMKNADGELVKQTYFSALDRCSQDVADTLCVSENAIKQMKTDFPSLEYLYRKSDNAACYAGNGVAENEYYICSKNDITLLRHDYNEPQMGKDQCDRDSAVAKKFINAFVHAGNDCLSASDIKKGILFKGGPKNCKVCTVDVDKTKSYLSESKITNISYFHSVSFTAKVMTFWQYYDCGNGKKVPLKDLGFRSGVEVISSFETMRPFEDHRSTRKRKDRGLHPIFCCTVAGCIESFDTEDQLNMHLIKNQHRYFTSESTYDVIKSNYSKLLQQSSHSVCVRESEEPADTNILCNDSELMMTFNSVGWALPQRNFSRFTYLQKKFVFDEFRMGEETGKKMTGEKSALKMRSMRDPTGKRLFSCKDYLTKDQISGLFSRFSKDKKLGKLVEPVPNSKDNEVEREDEIFTNERGREAEMIDMLNESMVLIKSHFDLSVNDYVYVTFASSNSKRKASRCEHFVGQITNINNDIIEVSLLDVSSSGSYYYWPTQVKKWCIERTDIHLKLSCPSVDRRLHLLFQEDDLEDIKNCCKS